MPGNALHATPAQTGPNGAGRRLSGWVRLWIVSAVAIWAAGVSDGLIRTERELWDWGPSAPLPLLMSREQICALLSHESPVEVKSPDPTNRFSGFRQPSPAKSCLYDDALFSQMATWRWENFFNDWGRYWPYWIAPFALGLLMLGAAWIRSGFTAKDSA